jgi:hypothetical protein
MRATRRAFTEAWGAHINRTQLAVLCAVVYHTSAYSRLSAAIFAANIAATINMTDENGVVGENQVRAVRKALRQLRDLGIIAYEPSRKQGIKSWISIDPTLTARHATTSATGVGPDHLDTPGVGVVNDSPNREEDTNGYGTSSIAPTEDLLPPQGQKVSSLPGEPGDTLDPSATSRDTVDDRDEDPFETDVDGEGFEPYSDRDDDDR